MREIRKIIIKKNLNQKLIFNNNINVNFGVYSYFKSIK